MFGHDKMRFWFACVSRTVCDPVLGDGGSLYVPAEFVDLYRDKLVPHAFLLTPNQTEAQLRRSVWALDSALSL